jgi:hypothetical protein
MIDSPVLPAGMTGVAARASLFMAVGLSPISVTYKRLLSAGYPISAAVVGAAPLRLMVRSPQMAASQTARVRR